MARAFRDRLTYANVMSTLAVFLTLGGTAYALTLPRNSVGREQLQTNSVGGGEIRRRAVGSVEVRNRSIQLRDISISARASLKRSPVEFFQSVNSAGIRGTGNADTISPAGSNGTLVEFSRSVSNCVAVASITSLPGGTNPDPPRGGQVTAQTTTDGRVLVRTYDAGGDAVLAPFSLIVAC